MNAMNKHLFITSGEKALLAYKGVSFTILHVEQSTNKYGLCWHVYVRFEAVPEEKIISLPSTHRRDSDMAELSNELKTLGVLPRIALRYRWRAYHFVPRRRWRKPPSLHAVLFLK